MLTLRRVRKKLRRHPLAGSAKVLCCGFHKTATTSLASALEELGLRVHGYDAELTRAYARGEYDDIWRAAERADAFRDWPWALLYKEFDQRFPTCRFILTVRESEAWIASLRRHAQRVGSTEARSLVYGTTEVAGNEASHVARYERHNADVRSYFQDRPEKLMVFDAAAGDGWEKLADFLHVRAPHTPFPHRYRSA